MCQENILCRNIRSRPAIEGKQGEMESTSNLIILIALRGSFDGAFMPLSLNMFYVNSTRDRVNLQQIRNFPCCMLPSSFHRLTISFL